MAAAAPAGLLCSCGIETVKAYAKPDFTISSGNLLTLTHSTKNDAESATFLGYEIYYRAYGGDDADTNASADRSEIETLANQESSTPETCVSRLEALGFRRFRNEDGRDGRKIGSDAFRPMFSPSEDTTIPATFNIHLLPDSDWYYNGKSSPTNTHPIGRWHASTEEFVSFASGYTASDLDFKGTSAESGSSLYFVFFAVAYGYDFSTIKEIHSLPASLYENVPVLLSYR